jgi:hypothetical protein
MAGWIGECRDGGVERAEVDGRRAEVVERRRDRHAVHADIHVAWWIHGAEDTKPK